MDIEKLKRCLKCCADDNSKACNKCELEYGEEECQNLCGYAATALSALQIENQALRNAASGFKAENEKLRAELEQMKKNMRENGIIVIPSKYPGGPAEWNIPKPRGPKED